MESIQQSDDKDHYREREDEATISVDMERVLVCLENRRQITAHAFRTLSASQPSPLDGLWRHRTHSPSTLMYYLDRAHVYRMMEISEF